MSHAVAGGRRLADSVSGRRNGIPSRGDTLADPLGRGAADPLQAKVPAVQAKGEVGTSLPSSSGGSPLPEGVRGPMESSFGADFSSVRVHTDGAGGAKAFARGEHVHFAPGQFDPSSQGGREVIGHELGHVQQQRAGRVPLPQFADFPVNDDPALEGEADREGEKAARGEPAKIAGSAAGLASDKGAAQGWDWPWKKKQEAAAQPAAQQAPAQQAPADQGGRQVSSSGALTGDALAKSAIVGTGAGLMATDPVAKATGGTNLVGGTSGGIGGTVLGGGSLIAAGMGLYGGSTRKDAAKKSGDKAGEAIGKEQVNEGVVGMGQAAVSTTNAAVDVANIAKGGATMAGGAKSAGELASLGGNALAVAGASLGIAGNALAFVQAVYEGGSAIVRWRRLVKSEQKIMSARGQTWHDRVRNRAKTKVALQGLKAAAAGLGIAAGALLLASNPVGWAIGLAAAATMGVMALGKLVGGWWKKKKVSSAAEELQKAKGAKDGASAAKDDGQAKQQVQSQQVEAAQEASQAPAEQAAGPEAGDQQKSANADPGEKKRVKSLADEAATTCSTNAKVAAEMVDALWAYKFDAQGMAAEMQQGKMTRFHEHSDAMTLVYMMGLDDETALSASGQELIEKKISATDGL